MNNKEGLILQGCGGEVKEWVDGINDILTENGYFLMTQNSMMCLCFKMRALPAFSIPLIMFTLMWANCQCGDCSHIQPLPELGFPIM